MESAERLLRTPFAMLLPASLFPSRLLLSVSSCSPGKDPLRRFCSCFPSKGAPSQDVDFSQEASRGASPAAEGLSAAAAGATAAAGAAGDPSRRSSFLTLRCVPGECTSGLTVLCAAEFSATADTSTLSATFIGAFALVGAAFDDAEEEPAASFLALGTAAPEAPTPAFVAVFTVLTAAAAAAAFLGLPLPRLATATPFPPSDTAPVDPFFAASAPRAPFKGAAAAAAAAAARAARRLSRKNSTRPTRNTSSCISSMCSLTLRILGGHDGVLGSDARPAPSPASVPQVAT